MPGKAKSAAAEEASGPVVVRRFRRFGRSDELGVVIASGWIDVEELADGSFRIAEGDLPLFDPSESDAAGDAPAPVDASPDPAVEASPVASSEPSAPAEAPPAQE